MAREHAEVETLIHSVERNHRLRRAPPRESPRDEPPDRPGRRVHFADPLVNAPGPCGRSRGAGRKEEDSTSRLGREPGSKVSASARGDRVSNRTATNPGPAQPPALRTPKEESRREATDWGWRRGPATRTLREGSRSAVLPTSTPCRPGLAERRLPVQAAPGVAAAAARWPSEAADGATLDPPLQLLAPGQSCSTEGPRAHVSGCLPLDGISPRGARVSGCLPQDGITRPEGESPPPQPRGSI